MVSAVSNNIELDDLRQFVESRITDPVDAALYASALDSDYKIDSKLMQDPVFLAFWKMQYLMYQEVVNPTPLNSGSGEISESSLEAAYEASAKNLGAFHAELSARDPELAAYLAQSASPEEQNTLLSAMTSAQQQTTHDAEVTSNTVSRGSFRYATTNSDYLAAGGSTDTTDSGSGDFLSSGQEIIADDARALGEKLGFSDDSIFWSIVGSEEGNLSAMSNIMATLGEMDQMQVDITEALKSGAISAEEFDSKSSNISIYRETLLSMMTQLSQSLMTIMEMYSKMISQANESASKTMERWKI